MKAVIQRVLSANITINKTEKKHIGQGLVILLGVKNTDTTADCEKLAQKCADMRIFDDENGNLNLSVSDIGGEVMVVSNFTLYGNTKKGNRPGFTDAAKPPLSIDLYELFVNTLKKANKFNVQTGEFGADMQIELINDGPITIVADTEEWKTKP